MFFFFGGGVWHCGGKPKILRKTPTDPERKHTNRPSISCLLRKSFHILHFERYLWYVSFRGLETEIFWEKIWWNRKLWALHISLWRVTIATKKLSAATKSSFPGFPLRKQTNSANECKWTTPRIFCWRKSYRKFDGGIWFDGGTIKFSKIVWKGFDEVSKEFPLKRKENVSSSIRRQKPCHAPNCAGPTPRPHSASHGSLVSNENYCPFVTSRNLMSQEPYTALKRKKHKVDQLPVFSLRKGMGKIKP